MSYTNDQISNLGCSSANDDLSSFVHVETLNDSNITSSMHIHLDLGPKVISDSSESNDASNKSISGEDFFDESSSLFFGERGGKSIGDI
ncbi:unnamed protein product [Vicia faba]|uniref:Uncharacterized protein n=1 Tax=Vicia faba TaxID=3906 RepID=A0AAV0ZDM0_VICFA|nr:unnamed protein product [Vicia faba]